MKRFQFAIYVLLSSLLILTVSVEAYRLHQLRRAEHLLQVLRSQALTEKFSDADFSGFEVDETICDGTYGCVTNYSVRSVPKRWIPKGDLQNLWIFRIWRVTASVRKDFAGRVTGTTFEAYEDRGRLENEIILNYIRQASYGYQNGRLGCGEGGAPAEISHPGLFHLKHPWFGTIYTSILATAPSVSKDEGYRLNLSCFEHFRGCKSADEIAPDAPVRLRQDADWEKNNRAELEQWNVSHCGRPDFYLGWK